MNTRTRIAVATTLAATSLSLFAGPAATRSAAQDSTPVPAYSCDNVAEIGTPAATKDAMPAHDMAMGSPAADAHHMSMEFDQMYIDMMIPHHASIVAMAQAARPLLSDGRLVEMADAIIAAQEPEIDELRGYREQWYGDAMPMPMDSAMMAAMNEMMPGISESMDGMAFQMDAAAQVEAICAAENPDLAFIDLVIPHHQMAIDSSAAALEQSVHSETRDFAQRVIDAQQREIDALRTIRQELAGAATATP